MVVRHFDGPHDLTGRLVEMGPLAWPASDWQLVQPDPWWSLYWRHRATGRLVPQAGYSEVSAAEARAEMAAYEATLGHGVV